MQDAGNLQFKRAIRRFEDASRNTDVAVVFYAGHGIEIGGTNYMVPVDAKLASDIDAQDEAITLDRIVKIRLMAQSSSGWSFWMHAGTIPLWRR